MTQWIVRYLYDGGYGKQVTETHEGVEADDPLEAIDNAQPMRHDLDILSVTASPDQAARAEAHEQRHLDDRS